MSLIPIIECIENIPCNPCEKYCPFGAITIGEYINNLPNLDADKCRGCGICAAMCPGLAIFLIDINYSETEALVEFPYEYLPLPERGDFINVVNKNGENIGKGKVLKILQPKKNDSTRLIQVLVSKEIAMNVRSMERRENI